MRPRVGDKARDFRLKTLDRKEVRLSELTQQGPVVLVVLRGWPEYQCAICFGQFVDYLEHGAEFAPRHARVLFVYPGPPDHLQEQAEYFTRDRTFPREFLFAIDPDYQLVNAYGLRWNAHRETAYPATYIVDRDGIVRFSRVSKDHGGRVRAEETLKVLDGLR